MNVQLVETAKTFFEHREASERAGTSSQCAARFLFLPLCQFVSCGGRPDFVAICSASRAIRRLPAVAAGGKNLFSPLDAPRERRRYVADRASLEAAALRTALRRAKRNCRPPQSVGVYNGRLGNVSVIKRNKRKKKYRRNATEATSDVQKISWERTTQGSNLPRSKLSREIWYMLPNG